MAEAMEILVCTKDELSVALVESGLSYEQPPDQDVEKVWEALKPYIQNVERD